MDPIEIKAEVFKVIRANIEKPKMGIMKAIKEHLPDISDEEIKQEIKELSK